MATAERTIEDQYDRINNENKDTVPAASNAYGHFDLTRTARRTRSHTPHNDRWISLIIDPHCHPSLDAALASTRVRHRIYCIELARVLGQRL